MKIEGLPPDPGVVKNITEKKLPKAPPTAAPRETDSVAISGNAASGGMEELARLVPDEFPARADLIEAVKERISRNTYNNREIQEKTAERLIDSTALSKTTAGMQNESPDASGLAERVESARARADDGYYNSPEALAAVAERLTEALGLTSLFGK
ncbi:MAG: flagellar biosynthesis anti-sigma factor FlgM [Candidatus Latescibacterota bacterium]